MVTPETITRLLDQAADAMGVSPGTLGRYAGGSGDFYGRLLAGHDITSRRAARVIQWLSDNWPETAAWPIDIPRPAPSPDSPAARPPEPVTDPLAETLAEYELADDAIVAGDREAYARHERRMWRAALTLREDGRIASVEALCKAVGVEIHTYDYVVRRFADGRPGRQPRNRASDSARMLQALVRSGDVRFSRRRLPEAS